MEVNNLPKQLKIVIGLKFSGLFESPLFLYVGRVAPSSQESGNIPELKIKLKNATYNGIISCAVALIYSFIIPSVEHDLLFFK